MLTAVTPSTSEVIQSMQTAEFKPAADWLGGLSEKEQYTVLHKLKVIATTAKLMDMMPKQFRDQLEKVVNTVTAPPAETDAAALVPKPTPLAAPPPTSSPAAPPPQPQPPTAGAAAMNMINQMMNSGVMQQMQEMGEAADDDMEQLKEDVDKLTREVDQLKRLMKSIMSKLEKLNSKSSDTRRKKTGEKV